MGINFGAHCDKAACRDIWIERASHIGILSGPDLPPLVTPVNLSSQNLAFTWYLAKEAKGQILSMESRGQPFIVPVLLVCHGEPPDPAFHGALQGEAPAPRNSPAVQKGRGLRTLHSWEPTPCPYLPGELICGHFKHWCNLQYPWIASQDGSATHLLCVPSSAQRIASGLLICLFPVSILFPGKPGCLFFFTVLECFWAKMHRNKTYFRWSQQHKCGQFRKTMQGILMHHCAGWSKCLQLLYFSKFSSAVCRFII